MTTVSERAMAVAGAVQNKLPNHTIRVLRSPLKELDPNSRMLFEFWISEGGTVEAATCYTESFFEDDQNLSHIASRVYKELSQRFAWQLEAKHK